MPFPIQEKKFYFINTLLQVKHWEDFTNVTFTFDYTQRSIRLYANQSYDLLKILRISQWIETRMTNLENPLYAWPVTTCYYYLWNSSSLPFQENCLISSMFCCRSSVGRNFQTWPSLLTAPEDPSGSMLTRCQKLIFSQLVLSF